MEWRFPVMGGVALGVAVAIWQFAAVALGAAAVFPIVATLIELVVVVGAMAQTRAVHSYGQQVAAGSAMAGISLVFIAPSALLVGAATPDLLAGVIGTLVTGVVIALVAAIPLRRKAG